MENKYNPGKLKEELSRRGFKEKITQKLQTKPKSDDIEEEWRSCQKILLVVIT